MSLSIKKVHDGARNASIQVSGEGFLDWATIVDLSKLSPVPSEVRLDAVYYAVSDKLEVQLAWSTMKGRQPFLPLLGRGKIDFSEVSGVHNTAEGKTGHISMRTLGDNPGIFLLILDLSKHIGVSNE